ncbi:MAG: heavy metal translocating P-type ATPase [Parvularculaceae bacterium]|nr:heavy metal translocating P-type ATPase [Parvularculaceae bacterium]
MSASVTKACPSGLEPAAAPETSGVVDAAPFVRRKGGAASLELAIFGAKCAGCIAKIEKAMMSLGGMESARLNLSTGRLSLAWRDGAVSAADITGRIEALGYRSAPFDPHLIESDHDAEGRGLLRALGVAGFATANVMLLSVSVWSGGAEMGEATVSLMHWASAVIAVPAALYAGQPFFRSAFAALKRGRTNMDVPISLAVILALALSVHEFFAGGPHAYFDAAVMLLFFLLIGRYLDHRLRWRAREAARDVLALQAATARRLDDNGSCNSVPARDIRIGDRLLLAPGDRVPVDGVVAEGVSYADLALVTGESAPVKLQQGDALSAGVVNLSSRLVMTATETLETSLIADLARLMEASEQTRGRYRRLADRAASLYVPVVHTLALATFAGWYFLAEAGLRVAALNAIAVLIITCPCALGLAAPAVQIVAAGRLFKRGVLMKSGDALERLAEARAIIFDKTGTLTLGRPQLLNRDELPADALAAAAALARISRHPLSRAVVEAAGPGDASADAAEFAGLGIEGTWNGMRARFGAADWTGAAPDAGAARMSAWLRLGERAPVQFFFEDAPRADAAAVIRTLREKGLDPELLSGDRAPVAAAMAHALGIERWSAEVGPKEKAARIGALVAAGAKPAMVGDGLNDAPSLAAAHVSLAPGTAAAASQSAADFVYLGDRLDGVLEAVEVARHARARLIENFAFAALYNFVAIPIAVFGFVTPLIAAAAMSGSSVIVILNALRLSYDRRATR